LYQLVVNVWFGEHTNSFFKPFAIVLFRDT
jgi:hypothetical protein